MAAEIKEEIKGKSLLIWGDIISSFRLNFKCENQIVSFEVLKTKGERKFYEKWWRTNSVFQMTSTLSCSHGAQASEYTEHGTPQKQGSLAGWLNQSLGI